jgi:hypothetical protein
MRFPVYPIIVVALAGVAAVLPRFSTQDPGPASTQGLAVHYDDSANGLKKLIQDAIQTAKDNNQAKLLELTSTLVLPDSDNWFKKAFGKSFGTTYAQTYAKDRDNQRVILASTFLSLVQSGFSQFEIYRFNGNCDKSINIEEFEVLIARNRDEPFSVVRFTNGKETRTLRFFFYSQVCF